MSNDTLVQILGTFGLAMAGAGGLYIVANALHWCAYGRQTLAVFSASQFFFVATRVIYLTGIANRDTVFLLNSIGGLVIGCIVMNLIVMHIQWHRYGLADTGKFSTERSRA